MKQKTYIVVCSPGGRFAKSRSHTIKAIKAKNLVELSTKYDFGDSVFEAVNPINDDDEFIDSIESIDISGWDGYAVFELTSKGLKKIADCGIFD